MADSKKEGVISVSEITNSIKLLLENSIGLVSVEGEIEIDESYFGARRVKGIRGRGARGKTLVFGMLKRDDKVYTYMVINCLRWSNYL